MENSKDTTQSKPRPTEATATPGAGAVAEVRGVDVFLSYNSKDHAGVEEVAARLADRGMKPFLDRWDLAPGQRWRPELERVLGSCGAVVVMLGPSGVGEVQSREVDVALRRQDKDSRFPVVPALLPGSEPPSGFLEQLTWVDLRNQSVDEGVDDLVRAIRRQWGADAQRQKTRTNRTRYLVNLLLLLVVLGAVAFWYFRHLHMRLAHVAVGGSVTILTLLRLAYGYFKWGAEEEIKNLPRRLLASPRSTQGLIGALAVAGGCLAVTSSVHLDASGAPATGEPLAVEVRSPKGEALWKSAALDRDRPVASRLFFFRFGQPAEIHLVPEGDRVAIPVRLGPGSRHRIRVPDHFAPREVRVLRLLPGSRLVQGLGKPGGDVILPFDLEIHSGGDVFRVTDLRRQAIYLGAGANDVETGLARESADRRRDQLGEWAKGHLALPEERARAFVPIWMDDRVVAGWDPGSSLDGISFQLTTKTRPEGERLAHSVLDGTNSIRTILIDRIR